MLWTGLDGMPDAAAITDHLDVVAAAASLTRDHARDRVVFRAVDHWLWAWTRA